MGSGMQVFKGFSRANSYRDLIKKLGRETSGYLTGVGRAWVTRAA